MLLATALFFLSNLFPTSIPAPGLNPHYVLEYTCDQYYVARGAKCEGVRRHTNPDGSFYDEGLKEFQSPAEAYQFLYNNPGYDGLAIQIRGQRIPLMAETLPNGRKWYEPSRCYDPAGCIYHD